MEIFNDINSINKVDNGLCVAIGTFDGFHLGHLSVIEKTIELGIQNNYKTGILAFVNIPKNLTRDSENKFYSITTPEQRLKIVEEIGVDYFIMLEFTEDIQNTTREEFLHKIVDGLNVKMIVVGENFRFGKKALGNSQWLLEVASEYGVGVSICPAYSDESGVVSSTRIRKYLSEGNIEYANKLLGREYSVSGKVQHGFKNGRNIGFPTANIHTNGEIELLKNGVYATRTLVGDKLYNSITNIGYNPTFKGNELKLETHIFDFDKCIYGEKIIVRFYKMIRDEIKFNSIEELKAQIKKDTEEVKAIL